MTYKFTCESCSSSKDIDMKPSEYKSEGHVCDECGGKLVRDISSYCFSNKWNCSGAYGKHSD